MSSIAEFTFELNLSGTTWTDISDYVIAADWQIGFAGPYDVIARAETLNVTLRNSDRRFSPEYASGDYYPNFTRNKTIKVSATYGGETRVMFWGKIDAIEPMGDRYGLRQTNLRCSGLLGRLQNVMVNVEVQEDKRADEVIAVILNDASFTANVSGAWRLGVEGASELGSTTALGDSDEIYEAEQGKTTFAVIGDRWSDETSAYGAIRDAVGQEAGRLFVSRGGKVKFWNRHHFIYLMDADETLTDTDIHEMQYSYGDEVVNEVVVAARPRTIGTSNEVLGQTGPQSIEIKADSTKGITFRYVDADTGQTIGGKDAVTPVKTTDYTANSAEDGSGDDMLPYMTATIVSESGSSCKVEFENASTDTAAWLQPNAQVRGIKVVDYGQIEATVSDQDSINNYGLQRYRYPYNLDQTSLAQSMANWLLKQRKNPIGLIKSIGIAAHASAAKMAMCLERTIGTRLAISETQTGVTAAEYFIIGEAWQLQDRQAIVRWQLADASAAEYWILGSSGLGDATILGPA